MTDHAKPQYRSYLLRLWRTDKHKDWRMMLESVNTRERHGFSDMEELLQYLREQMEAANNDGVLEALRDVTAVSSSPAR